MKNKKEVVNVRCPACGSEKLKKSSETKSISVPFGKSEAVVLHVYTCEECKESGDFARQNDAIILKAEEVANESTIQTMLTDLANAGIKMAYFERAMHLPQRTIARWKDGNFSCSALALLRIVRTYPWVLSVAEKAFNPTFSQHVLITEGAKAALYGAMVVGGNIQGGLELKVSDEKVEINARVIFSRSQSMPSEPQPISQFIIAGG